MKVLLVPLNDRLTIPLPRSLPPLPVSIPITQLALPVASLLCQELSIHEAREMGTSTINEEEEGMLMKVWLILIVSQLAETEAGGDHGLYTMFL